MHFVNGTCSSTPTLLRDVCSHVKHEHKCQQRARARYRSYSSCTVRSPSGPPQRQRGMIAHDRQNAIVAHFLISEIKQGASRYDVRKIFGILVSSLQFGTDLLNVIHATSLTRSNFP